MKYNIYIIKVFILLLLIPINHINAATLDGRLSKDTSGTTSITLNITERLNLITLLDGNTTKLNYIIKNKDLNGDKDIVKVDYLCIKNSSNQLFKLSFFDDYKPKSGRVYMSSNETNYKIPITAKAEKSSNHIKCSNGYFEYSISINIDKEYINKIKNINNNTNTRNSYRLDLSLLIEPQ